MGLSVWTLWTWKGVVLSTLCVGVPLAILISLGLWMWSDE